MFVLAVLQGLVEFLPVSSSGHLILVPALLGWPDQGLGFDIAVHVGTLAAVGIYFRRELVDLGRALFQPDSRDGKLAWSIIVATVPLVLAGLLFGDYVARALRSPAVIAAATAGFGVVLWLADRYGRNERDEHDLGWAQVLLIGVSQALALVPGTSRSGRPTPRIHQPQRRRAPETRVSSALRWIGVRSTSYLPLGRPHRKATAAYCPCS